MSTDTSNFDLKHKFCIESLGVKFAIASNRREILIRLQKHLKEILPVEWRETLYQGVEHQIGFAKDPKNGKYTLMYGSDGNFISNLDFREAVELFSSKIRLTVAEFAREPIFLHAAVVSFGKSAILIPGRSYAGKTTLAAEFARQGYLYFSDEYALLDKKGFVRPFPKKLSIRGVAGNQKQTDFDVERLGGKKASERLPVKFILLTEYKRNSPVSLVETSAGEGIMKSLANSISIRQNPQTVIEVLSKVIRQSRVISGTRGEAAEFVKSFTGYIKDFQTT